MKVIKLVKTIALIIFLILSVISLKSQNIPAEIIDNQINCKLSDKNELIVSKKVIIQINGPEGRDLADVKLYYDDNSEIESVSVTIFNSKKEEVKKIRKKDIGDFSYMSGYLHTDDRYKEIVAIYNSYPYQIELIYQQNYKEFFAFPAWLPQYGTNVNCRHSSYTLEVPEKYLFHYKFYNFIPEESITKSEGNLIYTWTTGDLLPINTTEPFSPPIELMYPYGYFTPDNFVFGGINGVSSSWKNFGNWNSKLIAGRDDLPDEEVSKMQQLTKDCTSDQEKVRTLYSYLQDNTRYIGVFIGIGGWKPFDATYVCINKYGDCKALTNYMKAMLKAVNITSYYSLINAGTDEPDIDTSFVSNQFNHVVLFVPLEKDTLWLECTSQEIPFGYWGTFTQGKHALVCDYENSFLCQTPRFSFEDNSVYSNVLVKINEKSLDLSVSRTIAGQNFERISRRIRYKSKDEILENSQGFLPYSSFSISDINYVNKQEEPYKLYENSEIKISNHVQVFGNRILVIPFHNALEVNGTMLTTRNNPIYFSANTESIDSITFQIPEGYQLNALPSQTNITSEFGSFYQDFKLVEGSLLEVKILRLNKGIYPKENYNAFREFVAEIIKSENQKILFEKL